MTRTVAVDTDGSGTAGDAVELAVDLAARSEAKIVFISACTPVSESRLRREAQRRARRHAVDINLAEDIDATRRDCEERAEAKGLRWASEARQGDPAKVLVELAESNNADVLVIGKGMERRGLGSVPNTVSHRRTLLGPDRQDDVRVPLV